MAHALIHVLPPETLSEIFLFCLPSDDFIRISNKHAPLVLTLVCSYWRRIAIASPQLWSSLLVHDKLRTDTFPLINTWLARSADRPLKLALMLYDGGEHRRSIAQGLLNRLVVHATRWQEIHLQLPRKTYAILFKRLKKKYQTKRRPLQLPFLETVTIHTSNDEGRGVGEMLCSVLQAAPRLRSLFWADFGCMSCTIDVLPQSAGLMELLLDMNLTVNQALRILSHCPQLRECTFGALRLCDAAPPPESPLLLPQLSSLTLHTCQDLSVLFDYVTLPALRSLSIQYAADNMEGHAFFTAWPVAEFAGMLWRSRCPLESLQLHAIGMDEWALIQSIQPVEHSLKRLRIRNFGPASVKDHLLRLWTNAPALADTLDSSHSTSSSPFPSHSTSPSASASPSTAAAAFCPSLDILELHECIDASAGALAAMVASRTHTAALRTLADATPLRLVAVSGGCMADYRALWKLKKDGALAPDLQMDLRSF